MSEQKASWVTLKPEEVKKKIIELAQQGVPPEKIGLALRDQHGIPKVRLLGLKIGKVLKEAKDIPETKTHKAKKMEVLEKHSTQHKHDYKASRSLMRYATRVNLLKKR